MGSHILCRFSLQVEEIVSFWKVCAAGITTYTFWQPALENAGLHKERRLILRLLKTRDGRVRLDRHCQSVLTVYEPRRTMSKRA